MLPCDCSRLPSTTPRSLPPPKQASLNGRPSNPYDPGQNFLSPQGIVAVALAKIARRETLTIRGDGSATKDYFNVTDLADAMSGLLETPALTTSAVVKT